MGQVAVDGWRGFEKGFEEAGVEALAASETFAAAAQEDEAEVRALLGFFEEAC